MSQISSKRQVPEGPIPYTNLEAILVDAGNTLVEMDYALFAERLRRVGCELSGPVLGRAEAAVRPAISRHLAGGSSTEHEDAFSHYMRLMLERALAQAGQRPAPAELERGVRALVALRREPGASLRIWSVRRPDAGPFLEAVRSAGLRVVVVSNADGTVEQGLRDRGLAPLLDAVVDSHIVGAEKPDPAIFRHALEIAGSQPARTLHVGDMYAVDVVGARRAGCHAVLLDPYGDWEGWECERVPDLATLAQRVTGGR
ncbi:MAG: HAD-IA family hydrolase [Myxococcota bacterium]|nr:HAD-IA family hydrolase [Myxococcota bacterium]